ncbi:MAG: nucleotide sugar dehydrogenase [bacterium]
MYKKMINKIADKDISIGVIGLGYVGLPLVMEFAFSKIKVVGFDIDQEKIDKLKQGKSYISHFSDDKIEKLINSNLFHPTGDFSLLSRQDVILICVPTPLDKYRDPDLSFVMKTIQQISNYLTRGQLIVLESTTYPGTTDEEILPILEKTGMKIDQDFWLAFSPEREDPGREDYTTSTIPKVVGGVSPQSTEIAVEVYKLAIGNVVPVSHSKVAEACKILENTYRAVNIALVNELKVVFDKMGINIWEVIEAAKTKPFGYTPFYPGPGLGGHCIPIDPFYLTWKAREYQVSTRFIELAGEVNTSMPEYVVGRVQDVLNQFGKCIIHSKILIFGVTYKPDIDDMRESPALRIIDLLVKKNAKIDYYDPFVPKFPKFRDYDFNLDSINFDQSSFSKYDMTIILTNHKNIDYNKVVEYSNLIIDTRNATKKVKQQQELLGKKIFLA